MPDWVPAAAGYARRAQLEAPHGVAGFPDLIWRVAELVTELALPARTVGPLSRQLLADFLDQHVAAVTDDVEAWSAFITQYPRSRLETAVSSLTKEGVLRIEQPPPPIGYSAALGKK